MARIKNHFEFLAGIHIGGELYFNRYSLTIDFYTLSGTPQDQNIAIDRMSYFIYDTVQRSIFIQEEDFDKINALNNAGLPLLTVPGAGPIDPILLAVIVTKMNAMLEDVLVITEAELVSELNGPLLYVWDSADKEDEVHKVVNDSDDVKWWAVPGPRFGSYPLGVDVDVVEEKSPFPLTWEMLNLSWSSEYEDEVGFIPEVKPGKKAKKKGTIIKADFSSDKPKKK